MMHRRVVPLLLLIGLAAAPASASPPPPPAPSLLSTLFWTNMCSSTNVVTTFATCASARLDLFNDGWLRMEFWNRAGYNGTWASGLVTAVAIGGYSAPAGTRSTAWQVSDGTSLTADSHWDLSNGGGGIPGPAPDDGFGTTNGANYSYASGAYVSGGPGSVIPTPYTTIAGTGYAYFQWYVGTSVTTLDPTKAVLEMHVQNGPNGSSAGFACYSDTYTVAYGNFGGCDGDDIPGTPQDVVPEPATMTLLGMGLVGMAAARKRRKQA